MKKRFIVSLILAFVLTVMMAPAAFADETGTGGYNTTYTVTIYPGLHGTLNTTKYEGHAYGQTFKGSVTKADVNMESGSRYYAKGFRLTGHDNNEYVVSLSDFTVTEDLNYEVAYGIKDKMVAYTVRYVDSKGKTLAAEDTYYGNVGDKPTVAYKYVDGYMPASYTLGKTLSEQQSENVFEFVYASTEGGSTSPVNPVAPGNNTNGAAAAAAGTANNANNANTANVADNAVPLADTPAQYTDLDDNETPQAAPSQKGLAGLWPWILTGIGIVILIALLILLLIRRRMNQDDTI